MKGFMFYAEHATPKAKRQRKQSGNVFAATEVKFISRGQVMVEGYGSVYEQKNSPVEFCSASTDWLRSHCRRIPEAVAREIHPNLFARLEGFE